MSREAEAKRLLEEQEALASNRPVRTIYGLKSQSAVVYDPIVVTNPYKTDDEPLIRIGARSRIDSYVKIEGGHGVWIGEGVHVASFAHLNIGGGMLAVMEGAAIASHVCIITGGNAPDAISCSASAPIEQQVIHRSHVQIGHNACLYVGAIVTPGVHIGEGARILPGAVVTKDVPAFEVWGGVPARFIRRRTDVTWVEER